MLAARIPRHSNYMLTKHFRWYFAAAIVLCAVLYWPALHSSFLFDDFSNLSALTSIDHVSSWRDLGIYLSQPRDFPGRPLSMLSFLLQKSDWPDHPFPFKLVNLALHCGNGVLVYLLALRVARYWLARKFTADDLDNRAQLTALLAAAAWLLNPIQLSGVVLVVQRMTLLMTLFLLLGLLAYLHSLLDNRNATWRRAAWMMFGLGVCMGLSFLCKENGILLPLYALVLDATVLCQATTQLPRSLQWLRRLLIWPVTVFVFGYLLWFVPGMWGLHGIRDFTVGERLLTEPRILASYLDKIFLPRFGLYGLYHDGYAVSHGLLSPWSTLPCIVVLLGLLAIAFAGLRRWPLLALAVLWYLGGQVLESSTVMLELYFEHRNYAPLIGVMMALALAVARLPHGPRLRLILATVVLWLMACCITTTLCARTYASEDTLALTWASSQPHSVRAKNYLAERLLRHGQPAAALEVMEQGIAQHPDDAGLAENGVYLRCLLATLTKADVDRLDEVLRTAPFGQSSFTNMDTLRRMAFDSRCPALNPQSWLQLVDTLLANPAYTGSIVATGTLHYQKHYWAVSEGNLAMAIQELDATYRDDPDANIPRLKAKYLISAGLYDQAIAALRDTDYGRLPLLRRLLVNDRAINAADIIRIEKMRKDATSRSGDKAD